jgi:anti-sigma regulatory factor (Ser/Thr protein kinase)
MLDHNQFIKYNTYFNKIKFPKRISSGILPDFAAAIKIWYKRKPDDSLTLDFSQVEKAFANGMLGIIAVAIELRRQGIQLRVWLPQLETARKFFNVTGWTHLLDTDFKDIYRTNNKHFVQQFQSFEQIPDAITHFMEVMMGHIQMPKDVLAALEWSITEICDNVINHSDSKIGGFLQVIAYPRNDLVAFTVADAGKGILSSLKEGIPTLNNDLVAIQEAIKAGVTRNKSAGQGNGLAGTTRITTMTGGSLDIITGPGRLLLQQNKQTGILNKAQQGFDGTCISGQIRMSHDFSIVKALTFGPLDYTPYTIVDAKYEMENEDALYLNISEQVNGAGTRAAGKELHNKIINLIDAKPGYPIYLDWKDVTIIASSFADEFLGKLYIKLGKAKFESIIRNKNLIEVIEHIINKAITERAATG